MIETVCAFTGHRPAKLPWNNNNESPRLALFLATVETQMVALTERGIVHFFSGMAEGSDMICAGMVLKLRENNPAIKLHCALPFVGQSDRWAAFSRDRYQEILSQADSIIYVNRSFSKNCYLDRNRFMVDHSSVLLAVYDGDARSGTAMTVRYARKLGRELILIDPAALSILHENTF